MNQNQTESKPPSVEEPREEGLDETACCASSDTPRTDEFNRRWLQGFGDYPEYARTLERALRNLADAVGAMRVPQTIEDAALQIHVTLGPPLTAARKILSHNSVLSQPNL